MKQDSKTYRELHAELEAALDELQRPDTDIDEAISTYERAEKLIQELETRLKATELTIKKLKRTATKGE